MIKNELHVFPKKSASKGTLVILKFLLNPRLTTHGLPSMVLGTPDRKLFHDHGNVYLRHGSLWMIIHETREMLDFFSKKCAILWHFTMQFNCNGEKKNLRRQYHL